MGVCVCVISNTLLLFILLICDCLSERRILTRSFQPFPHLSRPRFIRTSWNSTLTMSKQIFHSKSSSDPKEKFPASLHYSLCDTSTLLVWHTTDWAASVFWSQNSLFTFSFNSPFDPVSIASIASRKQFERASYMHTLATNILAVEKKSHQDIRFTTNPTFYLALSRS